MAALGEDLVDEIGQGPLPLEQSDDEVRLKAWLLHGSDDEVRLTAQVLHALLRGMV